MVRHRWQAGDLGMWDNRSTSHYANRDYTEKRVMRRLEIAQAAKSNHRAVIRDAAETWEQRQITWGGMPEIIMTYVSLVAAASDIPATRLMGKAPDGMNATGEGVKITLPDTPDMPQMDLDWKIPAFDLAYWLHPAAAGHGYARAAVRLLTAFAFEQLHARRVMIACDTRNERSRRVPESLGFPCEGCLRNHTLGADGQPFSSARPAFSGEPTTPMTRAPRWFAHCDRIWPTPPAAAWTTIVSPGPTG